MDGYLTRGLSIKKEQLIYSQRWAGKSSFCVIQVFTYFFLVIEKQTNSLFCEQARWIHTCHFISQDDCHTLCRPVPSFIKGGLSTVSQGSALAPMTGTIVKVGFSSDIWPE